MRTLVLLVALTLVLGVAPGGHAADTSNLTGNLFRQNCGSCRTACGRLPTPGSAKRATPSFEGSTADNSPDGPFASTWSQSTS